MSNSAEEKPKNLIEQGDIFKLGDHILVCGDATDERIVEKAVGGA